MDGQNGKIAATPKQAQAPRGINHVVLTVKNMEESHKFWTEILGFRQVAEIKPKPGRPPIKMRFYSGLDENGDVNHHDIALMEVPETADRSVPTEPWGLAPNRVGLNHVAITWPDRQSWLKQIAFMQEKGVAFHIRTNHGMTHSAYISDPNGHGVEVLYELPREVWAGDIDGALNYATSLPTEGKEALVDKHEGVPVFKPQAAE